MVRKALVIYGKEVRVLRRDYRLIGGMVASALVFFPLLMGLASNLDRLAGDDGGPVPVVAPGADDVLRRALDANTLVRLATLEEVAGEQAHVSVLREGDAYRIRAESGESSVWAAAMSLRLDLEAVRQRVIEERMAERGLRMRDLRPFEVVLIDTSGGFGGALSLLVPYMAVILLVTNAARALYIAVGEKEKNTLAALLVSTVPRPAIVIGKSLAIMTFAVVASLLLIVGMVVAARLGLSPEDFAGSGGWSLAPAQVAALTVNLVALALLVSALVMLIGTFARSQREAGMYTAPLVFLSIFLAIFALSPASFGSSVYAVPILGNALAMREAMQGRIDWMVLGLVVGVNLVGFLFLTLCSVRLYGRESVLFRV